ncbi:hypothetical protein EDB92DRAFT_1820037 [Lactarius akahatsu]|uniref:Uncharacterized protein n=1 Tax=Lactarius akahatsu TaxID=416441 RepID=A0AAD4L809_9AGAM|nr:hypothetical protein EDB92DRAFT_1820037 [Lactarius akahatsu]
MSHKRVRDNNLPMAVRRKELQTCTIHQNQGTIDQAHTSHREHEAVETGPGTSSSGPFCIFERIRGSWESHHCDRFTAVFRGLAGVFGGAVTGETVTLKVLYGNEHLAECIIDEDFVSPANASGVSVLLPKTTQISEEMALLQSYQVWWQEIKTDALGGA